MIWKIVVSKVITAGSMVTRHMKCHVTWLSVDVSLQISEVDWGLMITLDMTFFKISSGALGIYKS